MTNEVGVDVMKKILVFFSILLLSIAISSCDMIKNKKVIPELDDETQISQDHTGSEVVITPSEDIQDEKSAENDVTEDSISNDTTDTSGSSALNPENAPSNLDSSKIIYWMPQLNKEHKVPVLNTKYKNLLDKYGGYFTGDTSSKVIYLTFDEGYEYKKLMLTPRILDILKANDVKATFFLTKPYIRDNPELVKRMAEEGHICANHTTTHPSLPDLSSEKIIEELTTTADFFKEITGREMDKYMRPPKGEWSERMLYSANSIGYKTILWSMAHKDWDVNNQPGRDAAYNFVDTRYHNGAILLLHPQSKSNADALEDIIKNLKSKGYRFASLDELK